MFIFLLWNSYFSMFSSCESSILILLVTFYFGILILGSFDYAKGDSDFERGEETYWNGVYNAIFMFIIAL